MNERNDAIRDVSKLGLPKTLLLGLQHMFAMFGATILRAKDSPYRLPCSAQVWVPYFSIFVQC